MRVRDEEIETNDKMSFLVTEFYTQKNNEKKKKKKFHVCLLFFFSFVYNNNNNKKKKKKKKRKEKDSLWDWSTNEIVNMKNMTIHVGELN
jgi:hypothetical protein